jgi:hypothetical protein
MSRRKKPIPEIDWTAVRAAKLRSKLGRSQPGDSVLCYAAFQADEKRYELIDQETNDESISYVNPGHKSPKAVCPECSREVLIVSGRWSYHDRHPPCRALCPNSHKDYEGKTQ